MRLHLPVIGQVAPPVMGGALPLDPLVDLFARHVRYLRVSVTDRCNYRCSYCMPEALGTSIEFQPRAALLSFEEIERVVRLFAGLGVRKIRLTGGEPMVRAEIGALVRRVAAIPGIEQVVMTTNGHLVAEHARALVAAGLTGLNISIDTLDPDRFRELTGRGDLARVQAGIAAARAAGLPVQLNTVALRGVNDGELVALARYAWLHGATPRFIEHMPMSAGQLYAADAEISSASIRQILEAELGPLTVAASARRDPGPARHWTTSSGREVGIISAMTDHFCAACNRLRLTATGDLHACLGHDDAVSLRDVLRGGGSDDDLTRAIAASVTGKREGHTFERSGTGGPRKHMIGMGG